MLARKYTLRRQAIRYKKDIDDLIGISKGVSDHTAARVLANEYLYQAMAKKADITVTNKDLVAEYPSINSKSTTKFSRQSETTITSTIASCQPITPGTIRVKL